MESTKRYLGIRIQELRKRKRIKQADLAEIIGIDSKHMSKLECGRSYPSFDLLDKICLALDTTPSVLLDTDHLCEVNLLRENISKMLKDAAEEKVRLAYKILKEIL